MQIEIKTKFSKYFYISSESSERFERSVLKQRQMTAVQSARLVTLAGRFRWSQCDHVLLQTSTRQQSSETHHLRLE